MERPVTLETWRRTLETYHIVSESVEAGQKAPVAMQPGKTYINPGEEDQMEIVGYKVSRLREVLTWVAIVMTLGFLRLVFHWRPEWMLRCTHVMCPLIDADTVLLQDEYNQWFVEKVKLTTKDGTRLYPETDSVFRVKVLKPSASFMNGGCGDGEGHAKVNLSHDSDDSLIYFFTNKKVKYLWDAAHNTYQKLRGLEVGHPCSMFHKANGLSVRDQERKRVLYGNNSITVHVTPIIKLLVTQILNPFYVFQVFSMILWYSDEYIYYATCILVISLVSLTVSVYQIRRIERALKSTITAHSVIPVCRQNNEYQDLETDQLVPGDIIEVPRHGCDIECDAVLISGNCIVNESMLTGESVPVTKTPIPNPRMSHHHGDIIFNIKDHSRHVLFCGTHVIQTRYYGSQKVRAVVIRTGFSTAKGELVRSIMFPKPVDFKFSQDVYKFIGVLALITAVGMIYTLGIMIHRKEPAGEIILRTLDLITIVIPPALPAAMTVGIVFAQNRLRSQRVFCISPRSINLCGAINVFCFDKTGTLTEDGLDMWGVVPTAINMFQSVVHEVKEMGRCPMVAAMATCHSLTLIKGRLSGDPLDLKMFQSTGWDLEEPGEDTARFDIIMPTTVRPPTPDLVLASENYDTGEDIPYVIGILRQFTFSSHLQRMSVIARTLGSTHFDLYAKGAPEMIASLCKPETVPDDFHNVLMQYTKQGYRVIALAWRPLAKLSYVKVHRAQREQVECSLEFLGLLIMENRLKPETTPTIGELREANIRTIMITGDNMLTALSVARDCGIVERSGHVVLVHVLPPTGDEPPRIEWTSAEDTSTLITSGGTPVGNQLPVTLTSKGRIHFAITGKSWQAIRCHFPDLIPKLVVRGSVFARMSPEQKMQLIEGIQEVGYYVGMCGDGANDCGALKTAHAGISLSEAEASVASPFTSKEPNISCVPNVIREGRAALVTSFGIFKYMACYSLTQFATVCLLYWINANITDFQFLYVDLFLLTSLSITFGYTHAYHDLDRRPPPVSLLSFVPIFSILIQMIIIISLQVFTWLWTREQPWFEAFVDNDEEDYTCHEVTALFCVSSFQYITLAIVLSKGAPYRKTIFSNYYFLGNLAICILVTIYTVIYPFPGYAELLELKLPPLMAVRLLFVGVALFNFFICFILETFVLDNEAMCCTWCGSLVEQWKRKRQRRLPYEQIEEEISAAPEWPPVSGSSTALADILRQESVPHGLTSDGVKVTMTDEDRIRTLSSCSSDGGGGGEGRSRNPSTTSYRTNITNPTFEPDAPEVLRSSHPQFQRGDSGAPLLVSPPTTPIKETVNFGNLNTESTIL